MLTHNFYDEKELYSKLQSGLIQHNIMNYFEKSASMDLPIEPATLFYNFEFNFDVEIAPGISYITDEDIAHEKYKIASLLHDVINAVWQRYKSETSRSNEQKSEDSCRKDRMEEKNEVDSNDLLVFADKFDIIMNKKFPSSFARDLALSDLMTDMENTYKIPMLKDPDFEMNHAEVMQLYLQISLSRSFD